MAIYRLKPGAGPHTEKGRVYTAEMGNDLIESNDPLDKMFANKFERVEGRMTASKGRPEKKIRNQDDPDAPPLAPMEPDDADLDETAKTIGQVAERKAKVQQGAEKGEITEDEAGEGDETVPKTRATKAPRKGSKKAEAEPEEEEEGEEVVNLSEAKDCTEDFPEAGEADIKVVQVRGKGYFVTKDGETPINAEGMKKKDVSKFIESLSDEESEEDEDEE